MNTHYYYKPWEGKIFNQFKVLLKISLEPSQFIRHVLCMSWVFIGGTDVEAETPVLWPPLMRRADSLEKTLKLGKIEGRRRRG